MKKIFLALAMVVAVFTIPLGALAAEVTCQWTAAKGADGYRLYYGTSQNSLPYSVDAGQATTFTVKHLACDTEYCFEVRAYNAAGETVGTNRASTTTTSCPSLPEVPPGWEINSLVLTPVP